MTTERLAGLDAPRGVAASSVVLFHYTAGYTAITGRPFHPSFSLGYGNYGVELFFIISDFVIFMTLDRKPRPLDFLSPRTARL